MFQTVFFCYSHRSQRRPPKWPPLVLREPPELPREAPLLRTLLPELRLPIELLRGLLIEPLREPPKERVGAEEPADEEPLREGVNVLRGTPPSELLPTED